MADCRLGGHGGFSVRPIGHAGSGGGLRIGLRVVHQPRNSKATKQNRDRRGASQQNTLQIPELFVTLSRHRSPLQT